MEAISLIFDTFLAMFTLLGVMIVFGYVFVGIALFIWVFFPSKKVLVYTRGKDGRVVKVKIEEKYADLIWGDNDGKS